jgi:hypothetical protein
LAAVSIAIFEAQGGLVPKFAEMFRRLISAEGQSRAAKTVEAFGWLILFEGTSLVLFPSLVVWLLRLPPLVEQAENYFRLVGLLVSGLGMLYIASGRLNAEGFVFASLLDRPLVPIAMAVLWYLNIIPGSLALIFVIQDFGSFLWTLSTWRSESRPALTS